jgi:hypothetical protein
MTVKLYSVTVRHDNGIARLRIAATDETAARVIVMKAEQCPHDAIIRVREIKKKIKLP